MKGEGREEGRRGRKDREDESEDVTLTWDGGAGRRVDRLPRKR